MGIFSSTKYAGTLEWELIDNIGDGRPQKLSRAKVFGGWLINTVPNASVGGAGLTFLPDPNHEWNPDPEAKYKKKDS